MNVTTQPREVHFGSLMFGDRYRFVGDQDDTCYGPVIRTQDYIGGNFSAYLADGTDHYGGCFKKVVLLHRAPNCECGTHVDLCEADCEWPAELEELWQSLYGAPDLAEEAARVEEAALWLKAHR